MGSGVSLLSEQGEQYITEEFMRVKPEDSNRDYLVLEELRLIKPMADFPVNFAHLGTLFAVDTDRDGRITLKDLIDFAKMWASQQRNYERFDFQARMQGQCTVKLCKFVLSDGGVDAFVEWFTKVVMGTRELMQFDRYANVLYTTFDTAKVIHEVLNIERTFGYDPQGFFDLLQRVGEEMGLLHLDDDELDDAVPLPAIRLLAEHFIVGFTKMLPQMGFNIHAMLPSCTIPMTNR